ncbi:hypothetical protein BX616_011118 [Lobosporangium transversale]|uniref:Uncharacterized protein n=1 Tax=Lobosporangium transversale TaxID=64571 RepID=A0A1Y2GWX2_9FUNG|nr:hypothetical protein BCR41DRAFT_419762 [Lobosporangium transversale]KAF9909596.1 hypothetical protein BX616_011118 [Lobosporangium transversale]ORZ26798.1 hypothetical protein BCR41DRAFT_419762 [Lobosporangium transversale]|eukprot:XP_021884561.1 hypothetical protein BCR41DRAFT_419762 [Lobosporangium transversale]
MPGIPFWKHPDHRIPTLGLYRQILKAVSALPPRYTSQPGPRRSPIAAKGQGPPGSEKPLRSEKFEKSYIFSLIRDHFRSNRHCTSPRITIGYLKEAEEVLEKIQRAKQGDKDVRQELEDLVNGRTGRLKDVIDHLRELITFEPGKTTQVSRYFRLKRAHDQVWDTRPQPSITRDPHRFYRIPLHPSLFTFPEELDYYPPFKYPNQLKNQRGKFKNSGGVFLTEVTTSEGSKFPRIRGGTQPTWISMMLKARVERSNTRVDEWKELEEWSRMMQVEEQFMRKLGVDDVGYVEYLNTRLQELKKLHQLRRYDTNVRNESDKSLDDT